MGSLVFILIHSPLVGPLTWSLVARALSSRGFEVIVPALSTSQDAARPFWKQHVNSVARALEHVSPEMELVLVAHSGAGVLLPAIREIIRLPVAVYIFVDAGIPEDGKSRLELFGDPAAEDQFRRTASGGLLPTWSEGGLREAIPDPEIRSLFVAELRPLPLEVYAEPIPVFKGWPDAPCAYLRFGSNPAYEQAAGQAQLLGCQYKVIQGDHFHMLVEPVIVADALVDLVGQTGVPTQP